MTAPQPLCRHGLPVLDECERCDRGDELCQLLLGWMPSVEASEKIPEFPEWWLRRIAREEARLEYEEAREEFLDAATEVASTLATEDVPPMEALVALRGANNRWQEARLRRAAVEGGRETMTTPLAPGEPKVLLVRLRLCEPCLGGVGDECHTPGCALWLNRPPDMPVDRRLYEILDPAEEAP